MSVGSSVRPLLTRPVPCPEPRLVDAPGRQSVPRAIAADGGLIGGSSVIYIDAADGEQSLGGDYVD